MTKPISRRQFLCATTVGSVPLLAFPWKLAGQGEGTGTLHRVYARLVVPGEYPDDKRRRVHPPGQETYGALTHFNPPWYADKDGRMITGIPAAKKESHSYGLADVASGTYRILYEANLDDLAATIKENNLFLYDVEGYLPGCWDPSHNYGMRQFKAPKEALNLLDGTLGQHWLGMGNAEQDGRYIERFAQALYPSSANHVEQYLNFHRYFERMHSDFGNEKINGMVTLYFGHYLLKEGLYTLLGAETAQGLPNTQLYYSFIRGAGKQYGVPWFGMASVFNRWGYKLYAPEGHLGGYLRGPTRGASLSLLKRLRYNQILYNCVLVAYEQGFFYIDAQGPTDKLSPIGELQQASIQWVERVGPPGVMVTPIAIMLDFFSGWTVPRHLYTSHIYRVWGNLSYGEGDYLTHGLLGMIYPGYEDSSYFHDESGFITPTPYGDAADCILSDAEEWILSRYSAVVVGGELRGSAEIRDKLQHYVEAGGHLVITAGSLGKMPGGLAGVEVTGKKTRLQPKGVVNIGEGNLVEDRSFDLYSLSMPRGAKVLATCGGDPAAINVPFGKGMATIFATHFGIGVEPAAENPVRSEMDRPLANPYPLLKHVRYILDKVFRSQTLFEVDEGLSLITCRRGPGEYVLGVSNNAWRERPLKIVSHCGPLESVEELPLDQSEKKAVGYLPAGFEQADVGASSKHVIAGGDVRIFVVRVHEENVQEIAPVNAPPRPAGRILPLRGARSVRDEVLARPTFFEHFDGVVVDWKYLRWHPQDWIKHEAEWIALQKLRVFVDLTSGINLFPDLRLVDNLEDEYRASLSAIEDVISKMKIVGAQDLILSLHGIPQLYFSREQTWDSFATTLRKLCQDSKPCGISVHLRLCPGKLPRDLGEAVEFIKRVDVPNLDLAASTAFLIAQERGRGKREGLLKTSVGLWLASAPTFDLAGDLLDSNAPIFTYDRKEKLASLLAIRPDVPMLLDGVYKSHDEEYLDARELNAILAETPGTSRLTTA